MPVEIVQVDAFTDRPFAGNPAAVCVLEEPAPEAWMRDVAREMNLSETAFLVRRAHGDWDLRWFTPTTEVELCGHATLAGAHALWTEAHHPDGDPLTFHTASGELGASRDEDGWIELDFPAEVAGAVDADDELVARVGDALGAEPAWVGRNRLDVLVELADEKEVRGLEPDLAAVARLDPRGVIVTAASDEPRFDFVSRYFAPSYGIDEDPVTGSAHCALGPHWAHKLGKEELVGRQVSLRGGIVRVRPAGQRVHLAGRAVTVLRATLAAGADPRSPE